MFEENQWPECYYLETNQVFYFVLFFILSESCKHLTVSKHLPFSLLFVRIFQRWKQSTDLI